MTAAEKCQEALYRATSNMGLMNYRTIYHEFAEKGIPMDNIIPRVNVFTFAAWKAQGRIVRKGEHGVKVVTWIPCTKTAKDKETGEEKQVEGKRPWTTTVFHVSQTDPLGN